MFQFIKDAFLTALITIPLAFNEIFSLLQRMDVLIAIGAVMLLIISIGVKYQGRAKQKTTHYTPG